MFVGSDNGAELFTKWSVVFVWYSFIAVLMAHELYGRPPVRKFYIGADLQIEVIYSAFIGLYVGQVLITSTWCACCSAKCTMSAERTFALAYTLVDS